VPQVWAGNLSTPAVDGDWSAAALPVTPTIAESGLPGYEAKSRNEIVAPTGTPRAVINNSNAAIMKLLQLPDARQFMGNDGVEPAFNTADEFTAYLRSDHARGGPKSSRASG